MLQRYFKITRCMLNRILLLPSPWKSTRFLFIITGEIPISQSHITADPKVKVRISPSPPPHATIMKHKRPGTLKERTMTKQMPQIKPRKKKKKKKNAIEELS